MINKIKIITDGASDLPEDYLKAQDITNIPFYINDGMGGEDKFITSTQLYKEMLENPNKMFKTACPAPETYYNEFKKNVDKGYSVFCICISKELSGSFNSANIAKNMLLEENPKAQIAVIDSLHNSASEGLVVMNAQVLRDKNLDFNTILEKIEENKKSGKIIFFVDNLNYLEHGGRIGKIKSLVSKLLNIKPMIIMEDGNIHSGGMGIGIKKSMAKIIENVLNTIKPLNVKLSNYRFIVGYGANKELGESLKASFLENREINASDVEFHQIGYTSAVHTGPHTYGIALIKKV